MKTKKMYTGFLKEQRSNKSRSKVFSRTIRVGFKDHNLFQEEGEGWGTAYESHFLRVGFSNI